MMTYKEFLNRRDVISENDYNEIIDSFSKVDIPFNIDSFDPPYDDVDSVLLEILNTYLLNWDFCFVKNVDFNTKSFTLTDVNCSKDLEEIKETFSNWTITNYDELKECLNQEELSDKKSKLAVELTELFTLEELQELIKTKKYD